MATHGETFLKKTQRGLSILAFETTKQSRILKKRMRVAALQKEIKADLRDLGNLVYNAAVNQHDGILEEEEVKILIQNVKNNKAEVERLRDSVARLSRAKKHFAPEDEEDFEDEATPFAPAAKADEDPAIVIEATSAAPAATEDAAVDSERDLEASVLLPVADPAEAPARTKSGRKKADSEAAAD